MRFELVSVGVWSLLVAGCAAGTVEEPVTQSEEEIVRGKEEKKLPQVVAVQVTGYSGTSLCTGTYVAPRVVVSAAHCTRFDAIPGQTFVYFGKTTSVIACRCPKFRRPASPRCGRAPRPRSCTPTTTRGSTTRTSPSSTWTGSCRSNQSRSSESDSQVGQESDHRRLGTAARRSSPTFPRWKVLDVKRSATVSIVGTPTEADFHPGRSQPWDFGARNPRGSWSRRTASPRAPTLARETRAALLVKDRGCDKLAGVGFLDGLWCEDYAMFSRIDPFLDFFDDSFERAGHAPIVPRLDCVEDLGDGSLRAHFGYSSENGLTVKVPHGARNRFPKDADQARPSAFAWGDNGYDFSVDFTPGVTLTWKLSPPGGPTTIVTADASAPRCDTDSTEFLCAAQCDAAFAAECSYQVLSRAQCLSDCEVQAQFFDEVGCGAQWTDVLGCLASVPPDAENWDCTFQGSPPFPLPPNCDPEWLAAFECLGI